jgi:LysM repeat protein
MYSLHQFDKRTPQRYSKNSTLNARGKEGEISRHYLKRLSQNKIKEKKIPAFFKTHAVYYNNDNYFIVVQENDNLASISQATGVTIKKLLKYNDLSKNYTLTVGDILYLRKKAKRASKEYINKPHVVEEGQSMYDIAQMYGIRLKSLYQLNNLSPKKYNVQVGDLIWLR